MTKNKAIGLIILFTVAFFLVRIPNYVEPLFGEEGIHANVFYNAPENPKYLLIGRINGSDILIIPEHPAFLYESLKFLGKIWQILFPKDLFNPIELGLQVRIALSLVQYLFFLLFLIVVLFSKKIEMNQKGIKAFLIILISLTIPIINMSTSVQIDGSVGFLFTGILALSILVYSTQLFHDVISCVFLFITSILFGFGKNEWSMALMLTIFISALFLFRTIKSISSNVNKKRAFIFLGILLIGLLLGNLLSYLYDRINYLSGFSVMFRISKASSFFNPRGFYHKFPISYVNLFLLLIFVVLLYKQRKNTNFFFIFSFIFFITMFFAYFVISWVPDARYFAPSLIIGVMVLVQSNFSILERNMPSVFIGCLCFMVFFSFLNLFVQKKSINQFIINQMKNESLEYSTLIDQKNCVYYIDSGKAFGKKFDFLSNSIEKVAASMTASESGKELCP